MTLTWEFNDAEKLKVTHKALAKTSRLHYDESKRFKYGISKRYPSETTHTPRVADVEIDKETFKRMFPNLAKELELNEHNPPINSIRTNLEMGEKASSRGMFDGYVPDVIDFIRRCDTYDQAEEIIAYMEKKGEIAKDYAAQLRKQLKEKGVRSFGPKKEENYYLKHSEKSK